MNPSTSKQDEPYRPPPVTLHIVCDQWMLRWTRVKLGLQRSSYSNRRNYKRIVILSVYLLQWCQFCWSQSGITNLSISHHIYVPLTKKMLPQNNNNKHEFCFLSKCAHLCSLLLVSKQILALSAAETSCLKFEIKPLTLVRNSACEGVKETEF